MLMMLSNLMIRRGERLSRLDVGELKRAETHRRRRIECKCQPLTSTTTFDKSHSISLITETTFKEVLCDVNRTINSFSTRVSRNLKTRCFCTLSWSINRQIDSSANDLVSAGTVCNGKLVCVFNYIVVQSDCQKSCLPLNSRSFRL